jgi:hypothetical protein
LGTREISDTKQIAHGQQETKQESLCWNTLWALSWVQLGYVLRMVPARQQPLEAVMPRRVSSSITSAQARLLQLTEVLLGQEAASTTKCNRGGTIEKQQPAMVRRVRIVHPCKFTAVLATPSGAFSPRNRAALKAHEPVEVVSPLPAMGRPAAGGLGSPLRCRSPGRLDSHGGAEALLGHGPVSEATARPPDEVGALTCTQLVKCSNRLRRPVA